MPTPSAPISMLDIQNEFGGSNPISLNEYYTGGAYTTPNVGAPSSGVISIGDFANKYRTSTIEQIVNTYRTTTYSAVRNQLVSATSFANGLETSTALSFNSSSSATYRYSTSVTGTYTWPTSFDPLFSGMLRTSYLTFVMRNTGNGGLSNSLTVNGSPVTLSTVYANSVGPDFGVVFSAGTIFAGYEQMKGLTVTATYVKGSANRDNLQELFILPGRWGARNFATSRGTTAASLGQVYRNDIVFGLRLGAWDAFRDTGTFGGTASYQQIMRRASRWYTDSNSIIATVDSDGTSTFTPGLDPGGNLDSGLAVSMFCAEV